MPSQYLHFIEAARLREANGLGRTAGAGKAGSATGPRSSSSALVHAVLPSQWDPSALATDLHFTCLYQAREMEKHFLNPRS